MELAEGQVVKSCEEQDDIGIAGGEVASTNLQKSTDRDHVMGCHMAELKKEQNDEDKITFCAKVGLTYINKTAEEKLQGVRDEEYEGLSYAGNAEICVENAVGIKTLAKNPGKLLEGKVLFCRTVTPAFLGKEFGLVTVVEDITQDCVVTLELRNFISCESINQGECRGIIPMGSFLAVKNPKLSSNAVTLTSLHAVQVINSADQVELLSFKTVVQMFPDVKWIARSKAGLLFWSNFVDKKEEEIAVTLSKLGNAAHKAGRFPEAIRWFKLALEYASSDKDSSANLLANRAAAFLRLRCFHRALDDCNSALKKNGKHLMAITRKTKALIGLRQFEEAANFITQKLEEEFMEIGRGKLKQLVKIEETARKLSSEISKDLVDVDVVRMIQLHDSDDVEVIEDVIEYNGPLECFEDGTTGRGLRPTADIRPGQLLICSKAFAKMNRGPPGELAVRIAYKIAHQPRESGVEFYNLFAGPELGFLKKNSGKNQMVDMRRIRNVLKYNCFGSSFFDSSTGQSANTFTAIWSRLPSLLNHSCSDVNATWSHHKDIFLLRAIKEIPKGQQILISYVPPTHPYRIRQISLKAHSFECHCRLCELDRIDEETGVAGERAEYLSKLKMLGPFGNDWKEMLDIVKKLESLRKSNPNLNACLATEEVSAVAGILYKFSEIQKSLDLLEKIYNIEKEVGYFGSAAWTAARIIRYCLNQRAMRKEKIRYWVRLLKQNATAAFGSVKPLKVLLPEGILHDLEKSGIVFGSRI